MGHFSWKDEILRRKGKVVLGPNIEVKRKLHELYNNGILGGHLGG